MASLGVGCHPLEVDCPSGAVGKKAGYRTDSGAFVGESSCAGYTHPALLYQGGLTPALPLAAVQGTRVVCVRIP